MIRHTPFASWSDPDAWMEEMKGPRWKAVIKEEAVIVNKELEKPEVKQRIGPFLAQFKAASEASEIIPFKCGVVTIEWVSQFTKVWSLKDGLEHNARDLVCDGLTVWSTHDIGRGAEKFQLECWKQGRLIWKRGPVGPDVGLKNGRLYFLSVENKLIYHKLYSCDAATGKDVALLYSEKNPEANLSLEKQPDGRLLLVKDHSQETEFWEITDGGLKKAARHPVPKDWKLPHGDYQTEFVWPRLNLLVTRRYGSKMLWKCTATRDPKLLVEIPAGQIQIDPFSAHAGNLDCIVRVNSPSQYPAFFSLSKIPVPNFPVQPTGLVSRRYSATSKDGTRVYGILTHSYTEKPKNLLMIGYGAYGLETAVPSVMKRWAPLVQHGWAIGYTFVRGGGDHTEEWAKAGRRQGRQKTIQDFEALIRSAQALLKIPSSNTAIYGRSAGGLLMGATLGNFPDGSLMSAVYTEVPYVDVLRTTTNASLPLTVLEYDEFGNPCERLEDFIGVGLMSPADSAAVTASPGVFVMTRTAENDSQVFAYESVKWIRRLRSHDSAGDAPKLCLVDGGQGHFAPPEKTSYQWAVDCALLDGWIQGGTR